MTCRSVEDGERNADSTTNGRLAMAVIGYIVNVELLRWRSVPDRDTVKGIMRKPYSVTD